MIFLNQKMNLTKEELTNLINKLPTKNVVLFPTMPLLSYASEIFPNIGSQDVAEFLEGPYTGQTSIKTLKSLNVKYCLIGHYEKRLYLNETTEKIIKKIELCVKNDITPIYIVGEKEKLSLTDTIQLIEQEITQVFNNLHCNLNKIIIAYEPSWSIGTTNIDLNGLEDTISSLKKIIQDYYDITPKMLYGGGINKNNISKIKTLNAIDGYLIGSSSININEIIEIYNNLN